jgi:hypothetical protein
MIVIFMGNLYNIWALVKWMLTFKAPKSLYVLLVTAVVIGVGAGLLLGHILWA